MSEPSITSATDVPTVGGLPVPPPAAPKQSSQSAPRGDVAVASNVEPSKDADEYAVEARDAAVEKLAQAYEDADEPDAAAKVRAKYEDKPADATA